MIEEVLLLYTCETFKSNSCFIHQTGFWPLSSVLVLWNPAFHLHNLPKGVLQTGWRGDGFQNTSKHETEAVKEYVFLKVVSQVLTFKRDSTHYTQHRHFAAITLILCQHILQTETHWRIPRIKTLLIFRWLVWIQWQLPRITLHHGAIWLSAEPYLIYEHRLADRSSYMFNWQVKIGYLVTVESCHLKSAEERAFLLHLTKCNVTQ